MSQLIEPDPTAEAMIEDALRTYPLAPAPAHLFPAIMARVHALSARPRFHLTWLDYAISLFAAGMAGLIFLLWWSIPSRLMLNIQVELLLLEQNFNSIYLWLPVFVGLIMMMIVLLVAFMLFEQATSPLTR